VIDDVVSLTDLAVSRFAAYQARGDMADLESAIDLFRAAARAAPDASLAQLVAMSNLSAALLLRFEINGRIPDLDEALRAARPPATMLPIDHYARAGCLTNLAAVLLAHDERGGPASDLDEAIDAARAAGYDSPDPGATSSTLAIALLTRYEFGGLAMDLDHAHTAARAAVELTSSTHNEYGGRLSNLAIVLWARYEASGQLLDLDEAVETGKAAVAATARSRPERAMYESNLAASLWSCYRVGKRRADLEEAMHAAARAALDTPVGSPHRAARMSILALTLREIAARSGTVADLDQAVAAARAAVDLSRSNHPELAGHLSNLSIVLRRRGQHADRQQERRTRDLNDAVEAARLALAAGAATGQPGRAMDLVAMGDALEARDAAGGCRDDLDNALAHWREAAVAQTAAPVVRTAAAERWGRTAWSHGRITDALDGYSTAIELLPVLAWHGLERDAQEYQLTNFAELAAMATEAAITAGHPKRAMKLIEHGRAVLWTQQLHLRTDLARLAERDPDLANRLDRVRRALDRSGDRTLRPTMGKPN
jgi:tetratricopeptide (TPR) repeat protein